MNHAASLSQSLTKIPLKRLALGIASAGLLTIYTSTGASATEVVVATSVENNSGLTTGSVADPAVPLALTAASYQGTWDLRDAVEPADPGMAVFINGNGNVSCQDRSTLSFFTCSVTITNAVTGAFTFADSSNTASGAFNFLTGRASGAFYDLNNPVTGSFVAKRR